VEGSVTEDRVDASGTLSTSANAGFAEKRCATIAADSRQSGRQSTAKTPRRLLHALAPIARARQDFHWRDDERAMVEVSDPFGTGTGYGLWPDRNAGASMCNRCFQARREVMHAVQ